MLISAAIITFNEEKNIERCLKSIINIVDEIIVVDSFSTDRTEEICKRYNTLFIKNKFEGHIQQKNFAMNKCKHDYVLSLDADEELTAELQDKILFYKQQITDYDAYIFKRLTNFCGKWVKHSGWYPDYKIRLWNKKMGEWGGENPHDTVIMNKNSRQKKIAADILHYSFYSIEEHITQINKFSTIKADNLFRKNKNAYLLEMLFNPIVKFVKTFIFKCGFLDGFYGLVIALNSAFSNYLKLIKLYNKQKYARRNKK